MMTLMMFLELQQELFNAFGWFIRWWLILFGVAGVFAAALAAALVITRSMVDEF